MMQQRDSRCARVILHTAVSLLVAVLVARQVQAQTLDTTVLADTLTQGFHADRNYFSPEPFEFFDPVSGNIVLTFTDLTLPGNAGHQLRFQRTFNNLRSLGGPTAVSRWTFGFPGMVMKVIEQTIVPGVDYNDDLQNIFLATPRLVMADGSEQSTVFVQRPSTNPSQTQTWRWVRSGQFFEYDIEANQLWMPDGTICHYDANGLLDYFADPYGNVVTLDRSKPPILKVTQHLTNSPPREVFFTLSAEGRPEQMQYLDRTWVYTYGSPYQGVRDIETVTLPEAGPGWVFTYAPGDLTGVTTPNQGHIAYNYVDRLIYNPLHPGDANYAEQVRVLDKRVSSGPPGTTGGTWTVIYGPAQVGDTYSKSTQVIMPSGASVLFEHGEVAPFPGQAMAGGVGLHTKKVFAPGGAVLEQETRTYEAVRTVDWDSNQGQWWGTIKPKQRTITRPSTGSSQPYITTFTYPQTHPGNYHRPSKIVESGELTRTTDFEYDHFDTPTLLVVGLPRRQTITVGTETFVNEWEHDSLTGFRTSESLFGIKTTFTKDDQGNITTATKENGKAASFQYLNGNVSQSSTPGVVIDREINPDGTILQETVAGRQTTYTYDKLMRVTHMQPPASNEVVTEYDPQGTWVKVTRGLSQLTTALDGFGRPIGTSNSVGVKTRVGYDAEGRKTYESLPFVGTNDVGLAIVYDGLDRVVSETHAGGASRTRTYGAGTITMNDENGHETRLTRLAFGHPEDARIVEVRDATQQTWTYIYNAVGSLRRVFAPDNVMREWVYDLQNLLTNETHPESGTTTYSYDAAGVLKQKQDARGTTFVYAHDGDDRIDTITEGGMVTTITYEPGSNNRTSASGGGVSSVFSYDLAGRQSGRIDTVDGYQFATTYGYDGNDNVTSVFYPSFGAGGARRRIGYDYDNERRITRVFDLLVTRDFASGFDYHPSGGLNSYTSGNGVQSSFAYDPNRYWMTSLSVGSLWSLQYQNYDGVGNVRTIVDSRANMNQQFTYDVLDRLETVVTGTGYPPATFAYDVHGNRQTVPGYATYSYIPGTLRLETQNSETFTYDNNGNLLTGTTGSKVFTYTPRNMVATSSVAGVSASYAYDADDWRVKKVSGTTTTYYLRGLKGELLTEWKNPGPSGETKDYIYAGSRLVNVIGRTWSESSDLYGEIIANGPTVTVTLDPPGRDAKLKFEGTAGQIVSAEASLVTGSNGCGWTLRILKPDGTNLALPNGVSGWGCGYLFLEAVTLPDTGTYTLVLDQYFTLSFVADVNLYTFTHLTGSIAINGPAVTPSIASPGQEAHLTFTGTQGQRVSAYIEVAGNYGCGDHLAIRKPDGTLLSVTISGWGCGIRMIEPVELPVSGVYTLIVDPRYDGTGNSTVTLYGVTDQTGTITPGGPSVTATISTPGQQALFTFTGAAGQRVSAYGLVTSGSFGCNIFLGIKKPDGNFLIGPGGGFCGSIFIEPLTLPAAGTYTLVVDPTLNQTGVATVNAYDVPPNVTGSLTMNAAPIGISLTAPGHSATLTFAGTAGQQVTLNLTNNTIGNMDVSVWKPGGYWQVGYWPNASAYVMNLDTTGTYTVVLDPHMLNVGNISVQVTSP